jgi:hypothetical protein
MPTRRELLTLVLADGSSPAIDPTYFIDTNPKGFWSGSSYVDDPAKAWYVYFGYGFTNVDFKSSNDYDGSYVRLVHGEPF